MKWIKKFFPKTEDQRKRYIDRNSDTSSSLRKLMNSSSNRDIIKITYSKKSDVKQ